MKHLIFLNVVLLFIIVAWCWRCWQCCSKEKNLKAVIDRVSVGYFKYRLKDEVIVFANKGFMKIFELGKDPSEIIGSSFEKLFMPVCSGIFLKNERKGKGQVNGFECRVKTLNGKDKIITYRSCVVVSPITREDIVEVLMQDITEEVRYYDDLSRSQKKYKELFECSGDMVIMFNLVEMKIEEANPVTEDITGFSRSEIVGMPLENIIQSVDRQKIGDLSTNLIFEGKADIATVLICRSGLLRDVLISFTLMRPGENNMVMAVVKDVSLYAKKNREEVDRNKEMEEFLAASVEREERINELRSSLTEAKSKIKALEGKHGSDSGE